MNYSKAWTIGWLSIAGLLVAYELYAALDSSGETPTLTQLVVKYVPMEITLAFIFWLFAHFTLRYIGKLFNAR